MSASEIEKLFKMLNDDIFGGILETPVITVISSSRTYAHYKPWNVWESRKEHRCKINISSGTLNRSSDVIAAFLLHEMVHIYNDTVLNISDTSRGGTYHNKAFATACKEHGLTCIHTEKYGWAHTQLNSSLLHWLLKHGI